MKRTLQVLNEMERGGVVDRYAIAANKALPELKAPTI